MSAPVCRTVSNQLGLSSIDAAATAVFDVVVVGSGPAGLGVAVNAASGGLSTMVVDALPWAGRRREAPASRTSRIPLRHSRGDLAARASAKAQKFGVNLRSPCVARALCHTQTHLGVILEDVPEVARRITPDGVTAKGSSSGAMASDLGCWAPTVMSTSTQPSTLGLAAE